MEFVKFVAMGALIGSLGLAQQNETLKIVVVAGQGAVNILDGSIAASPIVAVRDKDDMPVAGARVTFALPRRGPRAVFVDGKYSLSVVTQNDGRSQPVEMHPMGVGSFDMSVSVQYRGQRAVATVKQTNYATLADAQSAGAVPLRSAPPAGTLEVSSFKIQILEGDDGVNIIDKGTAVKPLFRVVDKNNLPVAGVAVVVAIAVTRGAGAEFDGGKKSVTVMTDANGQAQVDIFRPKGEGSFQIQVEATVQGQPLKTFVTQTNYPTERAALNVDKMPGTSKGDVQGNGQPRNSIEVKAIGGGARVGSDPNNASVVEIRDAAGLPVPGAQVAFLLPSTGTRAVFASGQTYLITATDAKGRAEIAQLRPKGKGSFRIKIVAYYQGGFTATAIEHNNSPALAVGTPKQPHSGMSVALKTLLVIGGVAVAGTVLALSQSKSPSVGGSVHIGIGVGSPSVGAPR